MQLTCRCGKVYRLSDDLAGRQVRCRYCNAILLVPDAPPLEIAPEPPVAATTGAFDTVAGNPGLMRPDYLHLFRCYPLKYWILPALMAWSILGWCFGGTVGLLTVPVFAIAWVVLLWAERGIMAGANLCPGLVLQSSPCLVATFADMSTGGGSAPAVDIRAHPVRTALGTDPVPGTRLAMLCLYNGAPTNSAWDWLLPRPVVCLTRNRSDVSRTLASIPRSDWLALDRYVQAIPDLRPGLYRLWTDDRRPTSQSRLEPIFAFAVLLLVGIGLPVLTVVARARQARAFNPPQSSVHQPPAAIPVPARSGPFNHPTPPPGAAHASSNRPGHAPAAAGASPLTPRSGVVTPSAPSVTLTAGSRAEALDGTTWRPVTVLAADAAGYLIEYTASDVKRIDRVPADRIRPSSDTPSPAKWKAGDEAEVLDQMTWRRSKILSTRGDQYRIHYEGWADTWDEWVTSDRIRPLPPQH